MDGGTRLLGEGAIDGDDDPGPIAPPAPPPEQNRWEAAADRRIRDNYQPECVEANSWLVNLNDCYSTLQFGLLGYLAPVRARRGFFDEQQWRRETNLNPLMGTILDYIFLEKLGKEPFDFDAIVAPRLRDIGVPLDVGLPVVHEVVMYVMSVIGDIFPEMFFGYGVRISYEIVGNNDLWIATSKESDR